MTNREAALLMERLRTVFDVVRLVDVSMTRQYQFNGSDELEEQPYKCYAVWNKDRRCENCISAKAFFLKGKLMKFEFVDQEVFFVVSMYLELESGPYMMEMVAKVSEDTLFGAHGQNAFIESITSYSKMLYVDPLTGAYNRRYYEEQLQGLQAHKAVAMMDVDDFKEINDTFGHQAGDLALQTVIKTVQAILGSNEAVVRYGGDEFLLIFSEIAGDAFSSKLEAILRGVGAIVLEDVPDLRLTVSIGGAECHGDLEKAVRIADQRLYQAKIKKNCIRRRP